MNPRVKLYAIFLLVGTAVCEMEKREDRSVPGKIRISDKLEPPSPASQTSPSALKMEPKVQYSKRDPLYHEVVDDGKVTIVSSINEDIVAEASSNFASYPNANQRVSAYKGPSQIYGAPAPKPAYGVPPPKPSYGVPAAPKPSYGPPPSPHYYKEPEPIIEIIIKESNESLPAAPPPPPTPKPTKEPIQVFYVKYKKNPNAYGKDEVIYEEPIPALTPVTTDVEEHRTESYHPPATVAYNPEPVATTTLRTIIRPDSEIYHGTNLKVTFGKEEDAHTYDKRSSGPLKEIKAVAQKRESTEQEPKQQPIQRRQSSNKPLFLEDGTYEKPPPPPGDSGSVGITNNARPSPNSGFQNPSNRFKNPGNGFQNSNDNGFQNSNNGFRNPNGGFQSNNINGGFQSSGGTSGGGGGGNGFQSSNNGFLSSPEGNPSTNNAHSSPPLASNNQNFLAPNNAFVAPTNFPPILQSPTPFGLDPFGPPNDFGFSQSIPFRPQASNSFDYNDILAKFQDELRQQSLPFFPYNANDFPQYLVPPPKADGFGISQSPQHGLNRNNNVITGDKKVLDKRPPNPDSLNFLGQTVNSQRIINEHSQGQNQGPGQLEGISYFTQVTQHSNGQQKERQPHIFQQPISLADGRQAIKAQFTTPAPFSDQFSFQTQGEKQATPSLGDSFQRARQQQQQTPNNQLNQFPDLFQGSPFQQDNSNKAVPSFEVPQFIRFPEISKSEQKSTPAPDRLAQIQAEQYEQQLRQAHLESQLKQVQLEQQLRQLEQLQRAQNALKYERPRFQNSQGNQLTGQTFASTTSSPRFQPTIASRQQFYSTQPSRLDELENDQSKRTKNIKVVVPNQPSRGYQPLSDNTQQYQSYSSEEQQPLQNQFDSQRSTIRGGGHSSTVKQRSATLKARSPTTPTTYTTNGLVTTAKPVHGTKPDDKVKSKLAALPAEVPEDLRQQLLASGILNNADIQILDYDKVGDIPIENLPPEALEGFYGGAGAGSAPIPALAFPEIKGNGSNNPGNPFRSPPDHVVLNDSAYNRYLPLKVKGKEFPLPNSTLLADKIVSSVVVLAPVDYDYVEPNPTTLSPVKTNSVPQVHGVRFISGDILKTLVKYPTKENFALWMSKEKSTPASKQSVVLLVTTPKDPFRFFEKEIFMYDLNNGEASRLEGELSSAFVDVAESNAESDDLVNLAEMEAARIEAAQKEQALHTARAKARVEAELQAAKAAAAAAAAKIKKIDGGNDRDVKNNEAIKQQRSNQGKADVKAENGKKGR